MAYDLGIDVGTTFTAAAIVRDGAVEVVPLTTYQVSVPSVVFASGQVLLFGGAAERRGAGQPDGVAREFKRRVGDSVPLMLSGSPYHADRLTALMAQWAATAVAEQIGAEADRVVITHPANWTEYQLGTLRNALGDVGLGHAELISEPAAAAIDYAAVADLGPESTVLVYDLGGGTFDVALLRREGGTFEHVVEPSGIERLGGIDFDEAVFQFVIDSVPREVLEAARQRPEAAAAITQLRRRCVDAKEALSSDAASDIPVMLPDYTSTVRITRAEFEAMITPSIMQTIELVQRTLDRAQLEPGGLYAALLVGGSSRIPLVSQLVGQHLDVPVRIDAHPKLVTARGAARKAASGSPTGPVESDGGGSRRRLLLVAGGVAAAAAVAAGLFVVLGGDDEPSDAGGTTTPSAVTSEVTTAQTSQSSSPPSSTTGEPTTTTTVEVPFVPYAVAAEIPTLPGPIDLELVGNDLWVMSEQEGTLQRFDVTQPNPTPLEQVSLGFTRADGRNGNDVIAVDGGLFVTQQDAGTVAHVDLTDAERTVQRIDVGGRPFNGAVVGSTLLVTTHPDVGSSDPGRLVPIDIPTLTVGAPVSMPELPYGIVTADDEVWVTFDEVDRIGRVDLASGDVEFVEGLDEPVDMLPVGDDLWVTLASADQVAVVDRATLAVRQKTPVGFTPFKLAFGMGSVWVTNSGTAETSGTVSRLAPGSRDLRPLQEPIPLLNAPIELAVGDDRVYVANYGNEVVSVLAPADAGPSTSTG